MIVCNETVRPDGGADGDRKRSVDGPMVGGQQGRRSTHEQIALKAGVSVSTVDRVLNDRGHVSPGRYQRVVEAARELGFGRNLPAPWQSTRRIEVIIPRNPTPFWSRLDETFLRYGEALPGYYMLQRTIVPENDLAALKRAIRNPTGKRHALIIAADAGDEVAPELAEAAQRGEIIATLTTEIPSFRGTIHSGIDNIAAGRTAAHLMAGMIHGAGSLLVLPPQDRRVEFRQRIEGFRQVIADRFPVEVRFTQDISARVAEIAREEMAKGPVLGIYDSGHDSPDLAELIRALPERPKWIAHERSDLHTACLRDGSLDLILDQDAEAQAAFALSRILIEKVGAADPEMALHSRFRPPELRILCRENI